MSLLSQRAEKESSEDRSEPVVLEPVPAWKQVLENMQAVPDEVFDRIPADSSEQLDHYLYGTQKRTPKGGVFSPTQSIGSRSLIARTNGTREPYRLASRSDRRFWLRPTNS